MKDMLKRTQKKNTKRENIIWLKNLNSLEDMKRKTRVYSNNTIQIFLNTKREKSSERYMNINLVVYIFQNEIQ